MWQNAGVGWAYNLLFYQGRSPLIYDKNQSMIIDVAILYAHAKIDLWRLLVTSPVPKPLSLLQ